MSNRHRKKKQKPTLKAAMAQKVREIQSMFTVPMRVTIIARHATDPDAEIVFGSDQIDEVIQTLQRRRDAFVAALAAAPPTGTKESE